MKNNLFNNSKTPVPSTYISFIDLVGALKEEKLKEKTERYRAMLSEASKSDKTVADYKRMMPAFAVSELNYRDQKPENLINYDGYIIIDLDDLSGEKLLDLREKLKEEEHVVMYYTSIGGNGLKVVHSTDYKSEDAVEYHQSIYYGLEKWYKDTFDVTTDSKCKDYCRMSYLAYDEDVYFNPKFTPVSIKLPIQKNNQSVKQKQISSRAVSLTNATLILQDIYDYLRKYDKTYADDYDDWIAVCFALKNELSDDSARFWFHQLSSLNTKIYNRAACDTQFDNCKITRDETYSIGTIIYYAQQLGYRMNSKLKSNSGHELKRLIALSALNAHGIKMRYNLLSNEIQYHKSSSKSLKNDHNDEKNWYRLSDVDLNYIYLNILNRIMDKQTTYEFLTNELERYDPVVDFVKSIPKYDGGNHIKQLVEQMKYDCDKSLAELMICKWLTGFIGSLAYPNRIYNEHILVLSSPEQGLGKTRFVRKLITDKWKDYFLVKNINPENKDDKLLTAEKFLILFDEMSNMVRTNANVESFKALTSETEFIERRPYAKLPLTFKRIASYVGTINSNSFLRDTTGNRRFFILPCTKINYEHTVNMKQVYAEALHLIQNGYKHYLSRSEQDLIEKHNQSFKEESTEKELLEKWIEPLSPEDKHGMTSTDVIKEINLREEGMLGNKIKFIAQLLQSMGYDKTVRTQTGSRAYPIKMRDTRCGHQVVIPKESTVTLF